MTQERDTLGKLQAIANIAAAIIVPILIAYVGWVLQFKQVESARSQEFVKMALNILADNSGNATDELKTWAIKIIDVESPVPLSRDLSLAIKNGDLPIRKYIPLPAQLLVPPAPIPKFTGKTNGDLVEYISDLQLAYKLNKINHEALLEWLNSIENAK